MDILDFSNKIQNEYGLNPEFNSEELDCDVFKVKLEVGDLVWFGIGYNPADGNQVVVDKAVKFLNW